MLGRRRLTPLLTLDHEHGTAGVFRDRDGAALLSSTGRGGTVLNEHEPAREQIEEISICGGLLPPGASAALVRDARGAMVPASAGNGAWIARVEAGASFHDPVARFVDEGGTLVPSPLPDGATTAPLPDAADPCPACDAFDWQLVRWTRVWMDDFTQELEAPRCVRCGYVEQRGVREVSEPEAEEIHVMQGEPLPDDWEERDREERRQALGGVRFPLYGLGPGWRGGRAVGGWGSTGGTTTGIILYHGEILYEQAVGPSVTVESARTERDELRSDREICVDALVTLIAEDEKDRDMGDASSAAVALWFAATERTARERAHSATQGSTTIPVDGKPVAFVLLDGGDRWAACARVGKVVVTVTATGVPLEGLELVRIKDTEPYV